MTETNHLNTKSASATAIFYWKHKCNDVLETIQSNKNLLMICIGGDPDNNSR